MLAVRISSAVNLIEERLPKQKWKAERVLGLIRQHFYKTSSNGIISHSFFPFAFPKPVATAQTNHDLAAGDFHLRGINPSSKVVHPYRSTRKHSHR